MSVGHGWGGLGVAFFFFLSQGQIGTTGETLDTYVFTAHFPVRNGGET